MKLLSLQFETHTKFVATLIEILSIDRCGQSKSNSWMHFSDKTETNDALIVHTSLDLGVGIRPIKTTNREDWQVVTQLCGNAHCRIQILVQFLINRTCKLLAIGNVGMNLESAILIAKSKVCFVQFALLRIEREISAGQPTLMTKEQR